MKKERSLIPVTRLRVAFVGKHWALTNAEQLAKDSLHIHVIEEYEGIKI